MINSGFVKKHLDICEFHGGKYMVRHIFRPMTVVVVVFVLVTCVPLGTSFNAVNHAERRHDDVFRFKRDSVDKRSLNVTEKQQILDLHNKYRSEERATDMRLMEWDHELARLAQNYADRCVWTHSTSRKNVANFDYVGENLYASTGAPTALNIVKDWFEEKDYYDYSTGRCSKVCGHYTQVVWAKSYALGCGIRFCSSIQNLDWQQYGGGYVVVCNYGPGGNIVGRKPYTRGQQDCSECSSEFPYCIQGLCSKSKEITSVSSSMTLHQHSVQYILVVVFLVFWLS